MNYELALKLKNAGFKQEGKGTYYGLLFGDSTLNGTYLPTLEELVDACEEVVLWPYDRKWYAGKPNDGDLGGRGTNYYDEYPSPCEEGSSPSEAVANLWLSLNDK